MQESQVQTEHEGAAGASAQPPQGQDSAADTANIAATAPGSYKVIRRNGKVTPFDAAKIELAITKAYLDVEGRQGAASSRIRETVKAITERSEERRGGKECRILSY